MQSETMHNFISVVLLGTRNQTRNKPGVYQSFKLVRGWFNLRPQRCLIYYRSCTRLRNIILSSVKRIPRLSHVIQKHVISYFQMNAKAFWNFSKRIFLFKSVTRTWFFISSWL